jgi:hypothetical protein
VVLVTWVRWWSWCQGLAVAFQDSQIRSLDERDAGAIAADRGGRSQRRSGVVTWVRWRSWCQGKTSRLPSVLAGQCIGYKGDTGAVAAEVGSQEMVLPGVGDRVGALVVVSKRKSPNWSGLLGQIP